ncbi:MAG TPA: NAD(P)H-binding protein [Geobacterales bacterium]|nr:NAD(P)H-binding protein [Geobacterales bacterium]
MTDKRATILLTGASGFIGQRLLPELLQNGFTVRALVRRADIKLPPGVEAVTGDLLEPLSMDRAMQGIDTAFYLVHSMAGGRAGFARRDRQAAENFVTAATRAGIRRVIYLGGLGETGANLSEHLASRREVAEILRQGPFATTVLRAAIIIGAGGASFEMIRSLVTSLPVMITPRWVETRCQPIAVDDVIRYLVGTLLNEATSSDTFDIGGPDILTYREMMERFAAILNRPVFILPVPLLTPRLSSYWVGLVTSVSPAVAIPLIEGLKNEVICRDLRLRQLIPFPLIGYEEGIRRALSEMGLAG